MRLLVPAETAELIRSPISTRPFTKVLSWIQDGLS
jgi:hypothetical protein